MVSSPLECTHNRTTSSVACPYGPWAATRSDDVGRGMPSSPLGSIHGRTTFGVTCYLCPWKEHTVGRSWALQAIIAHRHHTWSDYVRRGMPSWPLSKTHDQTMSVMAMQSSLFECTHGNMTSYMTCYDRHLIAHTIR